MSRPLIGRSWWRYAAFYSLLSAWGFSMWGPEQPPFVVPVTVGCVLMVGIAVGCACMQHELEQRKR